MKYLILPLFLLSLKAGAQEATIGTTLIGDPEIGTFGIHIKDNIEPVWHKYLYTLTVKCKGEKEARELRHVTICAMRGHNFDQGSKNLEVKYTIVDDTRIKSTPCNRNKISRFNLIKECSSAKK